MKIRVKRLRSGNHGQLGRCGVLTGKKILIVDDEPDVLETATEVLHMCQIDTAGTFGNAEELLETFQYDMVILDIMGVKGLNLLDIAVRRGFLPVMMTAPAMNPEYILQSMQRGAISYIPKEDLSMLDLLVAELFEIQARGQSPWRHTLRRLEPVLDERLPAGWRETYKGLWDELDRGLFARGELHPS
jgi:DNA-binding NtrC family response regulator